MFPSWNKSPFINTHAFLIQVVQVVVMSSCHHFICISSLLANPWGRGGGLSVIGLSFIDTLRKGNSRRIILTLWHLFFYRTLCTIGDKHGSFSLVPIDARVFPNLTLLTLRWLVSMALVHSRHDKEKNTAQADPRETFTTIHSVV